MKINTQARTDQWNAEDLGEPRTFTIGRVKEGKAEQHHDIELVEGEGKVWRPPVTVLRILKEVWGEDGDAWAGRRVTLYCDKEVTFGRDRTGGIRVSHISGIDRPAKVKVKTARGVRTEFTIQPLKESAPTPTLTPAEISACTSLDQLREWWTAHPNMRDAITARKEQLTASPEQDALPMGGEPA